MSCLNDYNLPTIINQLKCWCIQWRGQVQTIFPEGMTQIEQIQELFTAVKNTAESQVEVMEKFCELYNFVNDYFENLDLQKEIDSWFERAINDGTLAAIISPLVVSYALPVFVNSLEDMTNKEKIYVYSSNSHIYYWGGSSFIDSGIVYGDSQNSVTSSLIVINSDNYTDYPDANELKQNLIYGISNTIVENMTKNLPRYSLTAILLCQGYNGKSSDLGFAQTYIGVDGSVYSRIKISSGWSEWNTSGVSPSFVNLPSTFANADELESNKVYGISASIKKEDFPNLPYYGQSALLVTFSQVNEGGLQLQTYFGYNGFSVTRVKTSKGFGNWHTYGLTPSYVNLPSNFSSADDLEINKIYGVGTSVTEEQVKNLPIYGVSGLIMSFCQVTDGGVVSQLFLGSNGCEYKRIKLSSGWTNWNSWNNLPRSFVNTCVDKPININEESRICVFGDSITTDSHGGFTWISKIAEKFSCYGISYGVGSAVFDTQNSNNVLAQVNNAGELSDFDIIFVAAGVNDAGAETPIDRLKTSVKATIDTIKQKAPNSKIIFITPIRRGGYGGQNLEDYSACIAQLALKNDCSVINGFDFPIQPWSNEYVEEATDGDGLHPNGELGKIIYYKSVLNAML